MKTSILSGLEEGEAEVVKREFDASPALRRRLTQMLQNEIGVIYENMGKSDISLSENWSLQQASYLAEVKARKKLISLLEK